MPLAEPPPRDSRFGSPLKLSRVHWVRPEVVVEVTYLTWTEGNLLRQVSYQGQREDKPAKLGVRPVRVLPDCPAISGPASSTPVRTVEAFAIVNINPHLQAAKEGELLAMLNRCP
jgi:ATP-dependent DNA ligase